MVVGRKNTLVLTIFEISKLQIFLRLLVKFLPINLSIGASQYRPDETSKVTKKLAIHRILKYD